MSLINIVPTSPILNIDVSVLNKVVLLPAASTCVGATFQIRDWKGACGLTNRIYISTIGLDRIDGVPFSTTQLQMTSSLEHVKLMSLGNTAWSVVDGKKTLASTLGISILPYVLVSPSISLVSFGFVSVLGNGTSSPRWTWRNTGGTASYSIIIYGDSGSSPSNQLIVDTIPSNSTSYTYTGATTPSFYYKVSVTANNLIGQSVITDTRQYTLTAPIITLASFTFGGTLGSTRALPTWTWTNTGGTIASYSISIYDGDTSTPTNLLTSTTVSLLSTSYTYNGSTAANKYYKFTIIATNVITTSSFTSINQNLSPPIITLASFTFGGTLGSTTARPSIAWSSSGGAITSYSIVVYSGISSSPTTILAATPPSSGDTSYSYPGATVGNYYYYIVLTAINSSGSSTITSSIVRNLRPPVISLISFSFRGIPGSTVSAPTLKWSSSGGAITSYSILVYGDVNPTPTTLLSAVPPEYGATSYTYPGSILYNYYYYYILTATNSSGSSSITTSVLRNRILDPVITLNSFTFTGLLGSTASRPTLTWTKSGGAVASYSIIVYGDANSTPTTQLSATPPSSGVTTYTYPDSTVLGYYYKFVLTATNEKGNSIITTSIIQNKGPPIITLVSFTFGLLGSITAAAPTLTWSSSGAAVTSYSILVYGDANPTPTTQLSATPPSSGVTTYTYPGSTPSGYYYKFILTATNLSGDSTITTGIIQNIIVAPVITLVSFSIVGTLGTIRAKPTLTWSSSGGDVTSYSIIVYGDANSTPTTQLSTTPPSSGVTTYAYGNIDGEYIYPNYYYKFILTARNASASTSVITTLIIKNLLVAPVITLYSFTFTGALGSSASKPSLSWSSSGGAVESYSILIYGDTTSVGNTLITSNPPSSDQTSYTYDGTTYYNYTYLGPTLNLYYYKFVLTATNTVSSSIITTDSLQNLLVAPVITLVSFSIVGTLGSTTAKPTLTWASSGGPIEYYTIAIYSDSSSPPLTTLSSTPPSVGDTSYAYGNNGGESILANYYYKIVLTASNMTTSSVITTAILRNIAAPSLSLVSFAFDGTLGSTSANPKLTWSNSGGIVESYTLSLLSGSTAELLGTPTSLTPPAVGDTSYTYVGATITDTYYSFLLIATNVTNTSTLSRPTAKRNRAAPNLTSGVLTFDGTLGSTSANPKLTWSNSGGIVESYTLSLLSGSTAELLGTPTSLTPPAVGDTSYTYVGPTITDKYYSFLLVATNVTNTSTLSQPTAKRNRAAPNLTSGVLTFNGTPGTTSAAPKLTWSNSGGIVESYTLSLLSGSTAELLGTSLSLTPPAVGDTTYTYAGATVNDTYYSFLLIATNVTNTSTLSQPTAKRNRAAPSLTSGVLTFNGTPGTTSAAPKLTWSNSGGIVESYTLNLLSGSTAELLGTPTSLTPPAVGDTTYTYAGATVNDTFYSFLLIATNVTNTSTLSQPTAKRNRAAPNLTSGVLTFNGTLGTTSAAPKLTWSNSGGIVESYTLSLLSGSTAELLGTPTSLTAPAVGDTSYTYAGATVNDTYYSFLLIATNVTNTSTLSQPTAKRNRAAPVITLTSFTFGGTVGSSSAAPTLVWTSTGGAVESYTLVVYGESSSTPTAILSSTPPASGDLSYAYPGTTYSSYYYKFVLTATNVTNTSTITTSVILNINAPNLSQVSFAFVGTVGSVDSRPTLTWSNSGGTVASYSLAVYGDTSSSPTSLIATITSITSGQTSYYYTTTVEGNYYKYALTATNAAGTTTLNTSIIWNIVAPSLSLVSFAFVGTVGSVDSRPTLTWSNSGGTVASYSLLVYGDLNSSPTSLIATITSITSGQTSYYYTPTVSGYYYKYVLTATNAKSPASVLPTSAILNISAPSLSQVSFAFAGTKGSTDAQPTLTWSNSGGTVASYTLTLKYGATSPPGTSLILTPPASGATSANYVYTYFATGDPMPPNGASITITNISAYTIDKLVLRDTFDIYGNYTNLTIAPGDTYTFTLQNDLTGNGNSFNIQAWIVGNSGASNQQRIYTSNNGVISIANYNGTGFFNVGVTRNTVSSYYYQYVLVATNAGGTNTLTTSIILNINAPSLSQVSFAFAGTVGSTNARPTLTWSNSGGTVDSYSLVVYGDTSSSPTTQIGDPITSITSGQTSYYYTTTVEGNYYKYALTATNAGGTTTLTTTVILNIVAPSISQVSFAFAGTLGSTNAQPTLTWSNSGGTIASYSLVVYGDTYSPPTTQRGATVTSITSGQTSYYYTPTVNGYYYKYALTATNAKSPASLLNTTVIQNIAAPSLSEVSFAFAGTVGSTNAQPTLTWSNSGGTVASYTLTLKYGATSPPGTSLILIPPASGATSANYVYTYFATGDPMPVNGASITITNISAYTIDKLSIGDNIGYPTTLTGLTISPGGIYTFTLQNDLTGNGNSFNIQAWIVGNSGASNQQRIYTSNNGVISIANYNGTGVFNTGVSNYTVASYYYQYVLVATNAGGTNTLTTSIILNINAPSLSQVSFAFAGTVGSTNARPTLTWSNSGGTVASYSLVVYGDTSSSPTSLIATITSITSGQTSYYYTTTVEGNYYKYALTATNAGGTTTLNTTVILNIVAPSLTAGTLTFIGTTGGASAQPTLTWSNSGGTVASYILTLWYGTNASATTKLVLTPAPASGDTSYTYTGTTNLNYYYTFDLKATNASGDSSITKPTAIQNIAAPSLSQVSFAFAGTSGSTNAQPTLTWSNSGGAVASYTLTLKYGATSPPGTSVTLTPPASGATSANYVYAYFVTGTDLMPPNGSSITITNISEYPINKLIIVDGTAYSTTLTGLAINPGQPYTFTLQDCSSFRISAWITLNGTINPSQIIEYISNSGIIGIGAASVGSGIFNAGVSNYTVASYYYQYVLVATNSYPGGSNTNTLTTSIIQNITFTSSSPSISTSSGYAINGVYAVTVNWNALNSATRYYLTVSLSATAYHNAFSSTINTTGLTGTITINDNVGNDTANISLYATNASSQSSLTTTTTVFINGGVN